MVKYTANFQSEEGVGTPNERGSCNFQPLLR